MTARHWHVKPREIEDRNPVGSANLAHHVAANGRAFPSPWPRRLCVLAVLMAVGAAVGLTRGMVW